MSHTVTKPFYAEEINDVTKVGDPFTPREDMRGRDLERLGLIKRVPPRVAPRNKDAARQPRGTK